MTSGVIAGDATVGAHLNHALALVALVSLVGVAVALTLAAPLLAPRLYEAYAISAAMALGLAIFASPAAALTILFVCVVACGFYVGMTLIRANTPPRS